MFTRSFAAVLLVCLAACTRAPSRVAGSATQAAAAPRLQPAPEPAPEAHAAPVAPAPAAAVRQHAYLSSMHVLRGPVLSVYSGGAEQVTVSVRPVALRDVPRFLESTQSLDAGATRWTI